MDKLEFNDLMKQAGLNKKELSEISNIPYPTINAWGSRTPYPPYLNFMLTCYIKSTRYEKIKEITKEI